MLLQQFKLASDSAHDDPAPFPSRDVDGGDILNFSNFSIFTHTATMKDHETDDNGLHNHDIRGDAIMKDHETDDTGLHSDDIRGDVTMKDHETDDTGLHNVDICGDVNTHVFDDLEDCTATAQWILGYKAFDRDLHTHEIESNHSADLDHELIDSSHDGQSHNDNHEIDSNQSYNHEIDSNQLDAFDSESINSSHDGQSCNESIVDIARSVRHSTVLDSTNHHGNENSDPARTSMTRDGTDNFNLAYASTTCDGNRIPFTIPAYASPDDNTDKTSDDVDTFDDVTVCDGVLPALSFSSDVDIGDKKDVTLPGNKIRSTDDNIDLLIAHLQSADDDIDSLIADLQSHDDDIDFIIADLNRFCLVVKLYISSGSLYKDSSIVQDTGAHINLDYDLDLFDGELAPTHNSNGIVFIHDVGNLFVFAQLDINNVVRIDDSPVEGDGMVPCQDIFNGKCINRTDTLDILVYQSRLKLIDDDALVNDRNDKDGHPRTRLPTGTIIDKLFDEYGETPKHVPNWQFYVVIRFNRDEKKDIMSYDDTPVIFIWYATKHVFVSQPKRIDKRYKLRNKVLRDFDIFTCIDEFRDPGEDFGNPGDNFSAPVAIPGAPAALLFFL